MWRHGDVAWAIFETVLMAFLGTIGAAIVALPLAFLLPHELHAQAGWCGSARAACSTSCAASTA